MLKRVIANANLGRVGRDAGLQQHIIVNPGHVGDITERTMATTVEAILGAIYLDSKHDLEAVETAMVAFGLTGSSVSW